MTHMDKIMQAMNVARTKFRDPRFKAKFLEQEFVLTKGYSNLEIYNMINAEFGNAELKYRVMPRWKFWLTRVRAYVVNGNYPIYVNAKILKTKNTFSIAGTLSHEICHIAGFGHGGNKPVGSLYFNSVVYKTGSMVKYSQLPY